MLQDPVLVEIISDRASKVFESKYPSLLVSVTDLGKVYSILAAFFRTNPGSVPQGDDFDVPNLVKATESGFLECLRRGAFDGLWINSPLSEDAQAELDEMGGVTKAIVDPQTEVRETQSTPIAECVRDYRTLGTEQFKQKWMVHPEQRQTYEVAIGLGQV